MNFVALSGYVKNIKRSQQSGNTVFQLAVSKGKDKNGEAKGNSYIRVKVFGGTNLSDGDRISITGKLDQFEYNEKTYYEVVANVFDIGMIESLVDRQNKPASEKSWSEVAAERTPRRSSPYNDGLNGPEVFEDDDIPF